MDATDRQRDAEGGEGRGGEGQGGGGGGGQGGGEETDIKSNNPHLTGGEKTKEMNGTYLEDLGMYIYIYIVY